jgi:hypothetical protein
MSVAFLAHDSPAGQSGMTPEQAQAFQESEPLNSAILH